MRVRPLGRLVNSGIVRSLSNIYRNRKAQAGVWNLSNARVVESEQTRSPRFVNANVVRYLGPDGKYRLWEYCSRKLSIQDAEYDAVGVIGLAEGAQGKQILVQKQFRPALNGICVEFPAGLIEPNESAEECAHRELLEETGYSGKLVSCSDHFYNDPGFCNTAMVLVTIDIDLGSRSSAKGDEDEFIETSFIDLNRLQEGLDQLRNQGCHIDGRLYCISEGIKLANGFRGGG